MIVVALAALVVAPSASAAVYEEYTREFNYLPAGDYDEMQNRLDPASETNQDTWNPVTQGSYYGGFTRESSMQLTMVPDTDCRVIMAQVLEFPPEVIMSGASEFVVRMPFGSTHYRCYLDIYQIENGTTWTFERNDTYGTHGRDPFRINFTAGNYSLEFFSLANYVTDTLPADGNDYYNVDGRPYQYVRAPIRPDTFYLFVATAQFNASTEPVVYWEPDDLCPDWDVSNLATYNELAPDDRDIEIYTLNVSAGFSFDFREGSSQGMAGANEYHGAGSTVTFYTRLYNVDLTKYLTFMLPFYSTGTNISCHVTVQAFDFDENTVNLIDDTQEWNDFILLSTTADLDTTIGAAWKSHWEGWMEVTIQLNNASRYRFHTRDLAYFDQGYNASWNGPLDPGGDDTFRDWSTVHAPGYRWQPQHYFVWNESGGGFSYHYYHWAIQSYVQLNDYYWQQHAPPTDLGPVEDLGFWDTLHLVTKSFFATAGLFVRFDDAAEGGFSLTPLGGFIWDTSQGPVEWLAARLVDAAEVARALAARVQDGLERAWEILKQFGQWLWKVGQAIVGAVTWFIEAVTYYASLILGLILVVIAFVVLFVPMWFSAKLAQLVVHMARGNYSGARADLDALKSAGTSLVPRRGGGG